MAKKSNLPEVRIVDEIRECMAQMTKMGTRCCELVADYMHLFPHKTDKKLQVPDLAEQLGVSESRIHQWWRAGLVKKALPASTIVPGGESQLRPLVSLLGRGDDVVQKAWVDSLAIAKEDGEDLTAEHVREAANKYKPLMQATKKEVTADRKVAGWAYRLRKIAQAMTEDRRLAVHAKSVESIAMAMETVIA